VIQPIFFYSTKAQTPHIEEEIIKIEGNPGNYKMVLPLPSLGNQIYTITPGPIRSLLNVIKLDDPAVKDVDIYDTSEVRIASSVLTQELLRNDFKLKLNNTTYLVSSPMRTKVAKVSHKNQETITSLQNFFSQKADDFETIPYSEYLQKAKELGLNETEARDIAHAFSVGGKILYLDDNFELNSKIFLQPQKISSTIETQLAVDYLRKTVPEKLLLLQQLQTELNDKEAMKKILENKATKYVKTIAWGALIFLVTQSVLFARLVWWDYDWGIMEPVTWFTSVVELTIGGYIYYLITRREYSSGHASQFFTERKFEKLCSQNGFDMKEFNKLKNKIRFIESDIVASQKKEQQKK